MSSRRSRSRQSGPSNMSDDQINDLVSKLQQVLPELRNRSSDKAKLELKDVDGPIKSSTNY
nr:transcription factor PRE3-like [Ipomoea trifida]